MVCVLQSKLPWSSAVFQFYCQPFFFPLKPLTFYTFYYLDRASPLLFCMCFLFCFYKFIFGNSLYSFMEEMHFIFRFQFCRMFLVRVCVSPSMNQCVWMMSWHTCTLFVLYRFKGSVFEWCLLSISSQQIHLRPVPAINKKTAKELYRVYYAPASVSVCVGTERALS